MTTRTPSDEFADDFVESASGAKKEMKEDRMDLVPPEVLMILGRHFGRGAKKYGDRNWEKGQNYSIFWRSCMNHMLKFWAGQDDDDDPRLVSEGEKVHHIDSAIWQLVCLRATIARGRGVFDDRPLYEWDEDNR